MGLNPGASPPMKHFLSLATVCLMTTSLGFAQEATWEELTSERDAVKDLL